MQFVKKLNSNLQASKVCRIDVGENSFQLILSILQDLIPNKNNFELSVYDHCDKAPTFDLRNKVITYDKLHLFKNLINARNVTLRISNTRIIIDLGEAINFPNMFVSLNKQFSKWVSSRIEPCSFARILKDNRNYFIRFKNKNLVIFFKEFCKKHDIRDFDNSEEQLNNFISCKSGYLVLGKQNGCVFNMSDHTSSYYYSDKEQEYLIDLTNLLKEIYVSSIDTNDETTNLEGSKMNTKDIAVLTIEQRCRVEFLKELSANIAVNKPCRIDLGKYSFNSMVTILQDLIKDKKRYAYFIRDTFYKEIEYDQLRNFEDIINARNIFIYIYSGRKIVININSSSEAGEFTSLNKLVDQWFCSRTEPCSFARILKDNSNYFLRLQHKDSAIFFKEFCKKHDIRDFDAYEEGLNCFINGDDSNGFILGKEHGSTFDMFIISPKYYSMVNQEYSIDLTATFDRIRQISMENDDKPIIESEVIKSQFIKGQSIAIKYDGKNETECLNALETLIQNAKIVFEPKKLIVPQYIWDFLSPIYTKILFNHKSGELNCFTDNYRLSYSPETKSWDYEVKNSDDPNLAIFIPLGALREKIDVEYLEPQFALAIRPSDK